jgi:hypothetical protein
MPLTWVEAFLLATLLAFLGLVGSVIAGMISHKMPRVRGWIVVLLSVALILAMAGVTAYQLVRQHGPPTGLGPTPSTSEHATPPVTPTTASSLPTTPSPAETSADSGLATPPQATQESRDGVYIVSVNSSTADTMPSNPTSPTFRYWYYVSADEVIGEISYVGSGGFAGRYGWVPTGVGKDCAVPYVIFTIAGIPKGTYRVSAHIPDIPDLATEVEYGDVIIDQAAHRDSWAPLGTVTVSSDDPWISYLQSQPYGSFGSESGCRRGDTRIAYDAIRAERIS